MNGMKIVRESARETPVVGEFDLCVIGGSCTGVFAAVRAARLGLSVAIVEQSLLLGGVATLAQVNEWHSLYDTAGMQIIGGLTVEVLDNLRHRGLVIESEREGRGLCATFNSAELALDLDRLVMENGIRIFLRASCVAAIREGGRVAAAIIEDKSGRRAIAARFFIDASGDGDLLRQAGFGAWKSESLQPVNYQMLAAGLDRVMEKTGQDIWEQVKHRAADYGYPADNAVPWINRFPAPADLRNIYGPRLNGYDAADADQLTAAALEGRRCLRALLDMIRAGPDPGVAAVSLAHALGVRETWHARCMHRLRAGELMAGVAFPDAIAQGTYPVDVHSPEGTVLRFLDGREQCIGRDGIAVWRRWRDETAESPRCYHLPYRSLVPEFAENLLVAGRLIDADREAFGGVRVMVNMNQTGEAVGTAAYLALREECAASEVPIAQLRRMMVDGGSLLSIGDA
ncbi:FAD dependent oxidoreductase [Terrimicrobium sacchariphilum]|uniref:FAD dependent oxidoreductase n=2 Tax=Terrimicrobium sacchariphilum TaxID=690879 RepID=A0A146G1U6_TERSA|nr:FAD dependent oxidoreductase [Terrimicrobium sacchariphilum]